MYSLTSSSFVLESSIPFDCTIRAAVPYFRPRKVSEDFSTCIVSEIVSMAEKLVEPVLRDVILCTTDSGELVVVDWDLGQEAKAEETLAALWPGLRVSNTMTQAKCGKDMTSLGRFIKVSPE